MNAQLIVAGCLGLFAAAAHGVLGELAVVRKLSPETLPRTRFGGPGATRTLLHVTWHLTTIAFLTVAVALLVAGSVLDGDAARGVGLVAAGACTGFAALTVGLGVDRTKLPRSLYRHPAPIVLSAAAALAWWGAL